MSGDEHSTEAELCLPPPPRGLCFDRLDFVKSNFSVDEFVCARGEPSLERLRDHLGAYLKVLRLAMIELINRDYANFVSLSATLVGFDRAVVDIRAPLARLKEEVLSVKQSLDDAMRELSIWRNQESVLREKRLMLQYYRQSVASLRSLEKVVTQLEAGDAGEWNARADRAAHQHARLHFTLERCGASLAAEHRAQRAELGERLAHRAEEALEASRRAADERDMRRALLALAALGRAADAAALLRRAAVAPAVCDLFTETSLRRAPAGLRTLYNAALALLDGELRPLAAAARDPRLRPLDFLVDCFWSEVESRLELQLASIFAPGDPRLFHSRYMDSADFLRRLEARCDDPASLRTSTAYGSFHKRWNLPVYFQIRFQEIAGGLEASLAPVEVEAAPVEVEAAAEDGEAEWRGREAAACWRALEACWADDVFVPALGHKFWKLTLQLLARYATWLAALASEGSGVPPDEARVEYAWLTRRAAACADLERMRERLPLVARAAERRLQVADPAPLRRGVCATADRLAAAAPPLRASVARELAARCSALLRRVSDVPRLYRKTNRSVPAAAGGYVRALHDALQRFRLECGAPLGENCLADLMRDVLASTTDSYYTSVEEVLTSVQKTEESLRRLKQIRGGAGEGEAVGAGGSVGLSDGDKIRLQVAADVAAYRELALQWGSGGERLDRLQRLVTQAARHIRLP